MNHLLISIPHAGEKVPKQCTWLEGLPEKVLMCDVDRFVDALYLPIMDEMRVSFVKTEWHRYAVDLNRVPGDVDQLTMAEAHEVAGKHSRGFHWFKTTLGFQLMPGPMPKKTHDELVKLVYTPFHDELAKLSKKMLAKNEDQILHLDLHSMPSKGTSEHRDPGELRADVVISDQLGKSASKEFRNLILMSFLEEGFKVAYNWPYIGGRITELYGQPEARHHTIQIELNRALYMDENSKQKSENFGKMQGRLRRVIEKIIAGL
jgi:N-formylglutamate deformylase